MTADVIKASFCGNAGGFDIDLSFTMPAAGVTALFGASGSGKTTILRAMAGLQHLPGTLEVGGNVWQDSAQGIFLPPHKRSIGYVFQEASLFPHLSVRQNLLYGQKRAQGKTTSLDDIAAMMNVRHLLDRSPRTLSGGERQRVAVGRALMRGPRLLLMDEPLSALDRQAREDMLSCLEILHRDLAVPILYVSHDSAEVGRLADHLVLIQDGRKKVEGPARSLFERLDFQPPDGRFETSVVLNATVTDHDTAAMTTHLALGKQTITAPLFEAATKGEARLRIRARDVALAIRRPEGISIRNILEGTISDINQTPGSALVELQVDIGAGHLRSQVTHDAFHDLALEIGKPVFALVKSVSFDGYGR